MMTKNPNLQFRNEFAREQGLTRYQATDKIAERARVVAGLANCEFSGLDKRGVLFSLFIHDTPKSVVIPHRFFSWESVVDSPSAVIEWARETRATHTPVPDAWPTILNNVSSAWFGS